MWAVKSRTTVLLGHRLFEASFDIFTSLVDEQVMDFPNHHNAINGKAVSFFQEIFNEINKEAEKARRQAHVSAFKLAHETKTRIISNRSYGTLPESPRLVNSNTCICTKQCRTDCTSGIVNKNELKQIVIGDKLAYVKVSSEWRKVNFDSGNMEKMLANPLHPNMDEFPLSMNGKIIGNHQYLNCLTREQAMEIEKTRQFPYANNDFDSSKEENLDIDEIIEEFVEPNSLKRRLQNMLRKEFEDLHEVPVSVRELMWYADSQNAALSNMHDMEEKFSQLIYNVTSDDDIFYLFDKRTETIVHSIQMASRHLYATNEHLMSCKAGQVPSSLSFRILIVLFKLIWSKYTMEKVIDLIFIQKLYFYIKSFYHTLDTNSRLKIASVLKNRNYMGKFMECFGYDFLLFDTTTQDISAINYLRYICCLHGSRSVSSITQEITEDIAVGRYFDSYVAKVNNYQHKRMSYIRLFSPT